MQAPKNGRAAHPMEVTGRETKGLLLRGPTSTSPQEGRESGDLHSRQKEQN